MNLVINPTHEIRVVDGCECRVYQAITEDGIRCQVLVAGLLPLNQDDADNLRAKFEKFLNVTADSLVKG